MHLSIANRVVKKLSRMAIRPGRNGGIVQDREVWWLDFELPPCQLLRKSMKEEQQLCHSNLFQKLGYYKLCDCNSILLTKLPWP